MTSEFLKRPHSVNKCKRVMFRWNFDVRDWAKEVKAEPFDEIGVKGCERINYRINMVGA